MLSEITPTSRLAAEASIEEIAPAKINLCLHVTGQRADGYHLLESIVTFTTFGDRLTFAHAEADSFEVSGPFGAFVPTSAAGEQANLVLRARDLLRKALAARSIDTQPVAIHLEKNLPVAAGIGGGSADAAAALKGLLRYWNASLPAAEISALGLMLGADVPMCLVSTPLIATGIGEGLVPLPALPAFAVLLGNPLVGVATPEVFRLLTCKNNRPTETVEGDWMATLRGLRNDLEPAARSLVPEIRQISSMIDAEGSLLTRMSGSGATCFGLFPSMSAARKAADNLTLQRPDWYFKAAETVGGRP